MEVGQDSSVRTARTCTARPTVVECTPDASAICCWL